ncbi:MAG: bifunctional DNA primase/polymerase [Actinomycetota bacterium]|nr:bifunctional DNA primase/polymerase [Actinomycetota bacterium]
MTMNQAAQAAAAALWLATHLGWRVLPLHPGTKRPLAGCPDCRGGGGHTAETCPCLARRDGALCHGVWAATDDPAVLDRWARRWRTSVWGVHLGVSGLLCVDLDAHGGTAPAAPLNGRTWPPGDRLPVDGIDTYATLASLAGAGLDIDTFATETPSSGLHLVYEAEPGRWKCSSGHVRDGEDTVRSGLGWQIDVKAHGGYVLLPGSTSAAGTYRRASASIAPALLPAWLTAELTRTGHDRTHTPSRTTATAPTPVTAVGESGPSRYACAALRSACAELAEMAPNSGRNRKLFRSTSRLAGMVDAGWIERVSVETALAHAAQQAGLPAGEIRYAIASGFARARPAPDVTNAA